MLKPGLQRFGVWVSELFHSERDEQQGAEFNASDSTLVVVRNDNRIPPGTNLPLRPDSATYMALWFEFISKPGYDAMDSLTLDSFILARYNENGIDSIYNSNNELYIKEDQLTGVRQVKIIGATKQIGNAADSLINNINQNDRQMARVEFWKSPVNFNGYKRQGNNIILYGIDHKEIIVLIQLNKFIYLLVQDEYFCLQNSGEFEPYVPEKDKLVIEELNAKLAQSQRESRRNT